MKLPTLYKLDTKGNTRVWTVEAVGPEVVSRHGILGGNLTETRVIATPKNVGRANSTTGEEQAVLQAKACWVDKSVKYSKVKPSSKNFKTVLTPMLAKKYKDREKYVTFPVDMQPKLDGYRCLARIEKGKVTLISRSGKPFSFPNIERDLKKIGLPNCYIDGELYHHDSEYFQNVSKLIKNQDPKIQFHVYDFVSDQGRDDVWTVRKKLLASYMKGHQRGSLRMVKSKLVKKHDDVYITQMNFMAATYEGGIIRLRDGVYKFNGRSSDLLKVKERDDAEFKIVDIKMATEGRAHGGAIFICQNDEANNTFNCSMKKQYKDEATFSMRRQQYKDRKKHIGRWITVEFFGRTESEKPREPVAKCFRDPIDMDPNS